MTTIRRFSRKAGLTLAALVLVAASAAARADVYFLVEEDGSVRLTNQPDDPRYRLFLRSPAGRKTEPELLANPLLAGKPYREHVAEAARNTNLDPALIHAVIAVESNYNPNAVSGKGAAGLMQLMPETARRYGMKAREIKQPEKNIKVGARYLADLLQLFDGDLKLALAGYNAGENVVIRYGNRIPPYPETRAYVPRVLAFYEQLRLR